MRLCIYCLCLYMSLYIRIRVHKPAIWKCGSDFLLYKEMGKHSKTNKDWYVYLLPHGRGNGQPKVGVSSGPEARLWALVRKGIEVKGARIIDIVEDASRSEAEHIEMLWQIYYGAIENSYRMQNRRRSFQKNVGYEKYAGLFTAITLGSDSVRI